MVARAPGRLDVMGGIADYGGSLVLQLPLALACHVAVQLQPTAAGDCRTPWRALHVWRPSGTGGLAVLGMSSTPHMHLQCGCSATLEAFPCLEI